MNLRLKRDGDYVRGELKTGCSEEVVVRKCLLLGDLGETRVSYSPLRSPSRKQEEFPCEVWKIKRG